MVCSVAARKKNLNRNLYLYYGRGDAVCESLWQRRAAIEYMLAGVLTILKTNGIAVDDLLVDIRKSAIEGIFDPADPQSIQVLGAVKLGVDETVDRVIARGNSLPGVMQLDTERKS